MTEKEYLEESNNASSCCHQTHLLHNSVNGTSWDWICTRPKHHTGLHAACGLKLICVWSTDYQPLPNFLPPC